MKARVLGVLLIFILLLSSCGKPTHTPTHKTDVYPRPSNTPRTTFKPIVLPTPPLVKQTSERISSSDQRKFHPIFLGQILVGGTYRGKFYSVNQFDVNGQDATTQKGQFALGRNDEYAPYFYIKHPKFALLKENQTIQLFYKHKNVGKTKVQIEEFEVDFYQPQIYVTVLERKAPPLYDIGIDCDWQPVPQNIKTIKGGFEMDLDGDGSLDQVISTKTLTKDVSGNDIGSLKLEWKNANKTMRLAQTSALLVDDQGKKISFESVLSLDFGIYDLDGDGKTEIMAWWNQNTFAEVNIFKVEGQKINQVLQLKFVNH